ncbi:MAG TPA: 3'-5' exonuclease [Terriglobales bacterium]|nr:3'-5' exonuclease [Terriglobales bacterium]
MSIKPFVDMLKSSEGYVVLDTETTGLNDNAEVCQIAVAASTGEVLLDTFVKPVEPIPAEATKIHSITNAMVADAPGWASIIPRLFPLLNNRHVVVYNADYDFRVMCQSSRLAGISNIEWDGAETWWCAMTHFAEIYGDWNDYHQSYRWQRLETAARYYKIPANNAHSALGDVLTTLEVCRKIAEAH